MSKNRLKLAVLTLVCTILGGGSAFGARVADVRGTLHNLSSAADGTSTPSGGTVPTRNIKATTEDQICVFCHTPHGASAGAVPLWNRTLSSATYTVYTSASLDAEAIKGGPLDQPGGSSKLCLSCHDGMLAIGSVNVLDGATNQTIAMTGGPNIPAGSGTTTGFTRNLGIDLTNDHPISVNYTTALAIRDGEYRQVDANQQWPNGTGEIIGVPSAGYKPKAPLEPPPGGGTAQIQCATCHDPHIRETVASVGNQKFLRLNRFQEAQPSSTATTFSTTNDIICLACHEKSGDSWAYSAHANPQVADETYVAAAADQRQFPSALPVWKAACLNCHDTHTVQGSRRLLREGTDSAATPKAGGGPAIEETCYQCHSSTSTVITPLTTVPAIKQEFALTIHMPITTAEQTPNTTEVHEIGGGVNDAGGVDCSGTTNKCGADFVEQRLKLGLGNLNNRHAECTDCHNPHRVVKFQDFRGSGGSGSLAGAPDSQGTHQHTDDAATLHSNLASGVLRGTYGVEPVYASNSFHSMPASFDAKRGDPGTNTNTLTTATYVTREYQICLKCHSNYGYSDNNTYPTGNRPDLGSSGGGTASGSNGLTQYTNQAKEFQAPVAHQNEPLNLGTDAGANAAWNTENHRSWHPVMDKTGRTFAKRQMVNANSFMPPWNNNVGNQTMYCTDCHGDSTASTTSVIPNGGVNGNPWGPHGSNNPFLLKGNWVDKDGSDPNFLCFKCHKQATYQSATDTGQTSGFYAPGGGWGGALGNLHNFHVGQLGKELRCTWCHVAVPHGWKNKSLLVNLNDVDAEAGYAGLSKEVSIVGGGRGSPDDYYSQQPYYWKAKNKIKTFSSAGNWQANDCGSANKAAGNRINGSAGSANDSNVGVTWMRNTCSNPP